MRSTTKSFFLFGFCLVFAFSGKSQSAKTSDFSAWYWLQVKYNLSKKTSLNFQYQCRTNQNASVFDKSNFFVSVSQKLTRNLDGELLYQLTTNNRSDQHTLFFGLTYRLRFKYFDIFLRSAMQHKRNHFTNNFDLDNPFTEFRNRIRISVPIAKKWTIALSTEPYFSFTANKPGYFSRIRNVAQVNYDLNNFHSVALFYLVEPTLDMRYSTRNDYVLGLTYQIKIPKKQKDWKLFLDFKPVEEKAKKDNKDTFN
jgi:hypothetical protein